MYLTRSELPRNKPSLPCDDQVLIVNILLCHCHSIDSTKLHSVIISFEILILSHSGESNDDPHTLRTTKPHAV